jgi:MFS transporter, PPP family, 3-phenylpropionic acid transporter
MKARLGFFYFAVFAFVGVHMPFWPVWLKSRGIDAVGIAALSALSFALKIVVTPMVSKWVDASGRKRNTVVWLASGLLVGCCLFGLTHGFAQILLLTALAFTCWSPIMALGESITTVAAKADKLDYGRIRLWGSISFMLVVIGIGQLLHSYGEPMLPWALGATAALLWAAAVALPRDPARPAAARAAAGRGADSTPFRRSRWFVLFIVGAMLIQGSHAVYYTFSSIHWRSVGLSDQTIGLLWGTSLVAEVLFFAFGRSLVDRLGPVNVLVMGGVAAGLRWAALGLTHEPAVLALVQLLHALSFGASHFAAIRLISERVDDTLSASGQGLYSAFVMGLGTGLCVLASGPLYGAFGAASFFVMTLLAVIGTGAMVAVRRSTLARVVPAGAAASVDSLPLALPPAPTRATAPRRASPRSSSPSLTREPS